MFRSCIRALILLPVRLFYPRIELSGAQRLPVGPAIYVLNHPNGLIDGLVLLLATGRRVSFLAKSTFYTNPVGRAVLRAFDAIPVHRRRDDGKPGGPQGDAAMRNEAAFMECRTHLRQGGAIAIFPEGTNSGPMMLPFHTGAARLALGAEHEAGWRLGLQIVPVGIWYTAQAQFRSAVLLTVGRPLAVADMAQHDAGSEQATDELTVQIRARLDEIVLQAPPDADVRQLVWHLAGWVRPVGSEESLAAQHTRTAGLLTALSRPELATAGEQLLRAARRYQRWLRRVGIDDPGLIEALLEQSATRVNATRNAAAHSDAGRAQRGEPPVERNAIDRCAPGGAKRTGSWIQLILLAPFAAAGAVFWLPGLLTGPLVPRLTGRQGATAAPWLIVGGALLLLGWLAGAAVAGLWFGAVWGLVVLIGAPILSYAVLRWWELWRRLAQRQHARWLCRRRPGLVAKLVARRRELATRAEALLDDFGF